jgi:aminoglycoside phosphotransferase family enzyme/predicted kinase
VITEDQSEVVAFLASPSTHGGTSVERVDTHASMVFLAGTRAWKLKRAVRYDYLDFSTLERRRLSCERELQINRRTAAGLYRRVVPVTRQAPGVLAIDGSGAPVEWLVEMVRFDQDGLFDRLARRGALDLALMRPLGVAIARFHHAAERRSDHGGAAGMAWVVDGNATAFAEQGARVLDRHVCDDVTRSARAHVHTHDRLLDARRRDGCVRQCHGDLHLRNIVLLDGRPTLFDAIEFNDEIACIDVLYDLAFLLMDLWHRQLPSHANAVWNGYLSEAQDLGGLALLPLFLSCRAAVRAKTSATAATLTADLQRQGELHETARDYLAMAQRLLHPPPASLMAVGGFSGCGKSTVARALAPLVGPPPGAVIIRSDEIRKQLCGVDPLQRLGAEGYTAEQTRRVYASVGARAAAVVAAGQAAVVDAVFARPEDRQAIERVAAAAGVPFVGAWLDAPEEVLVARVRQRSMDVSDADPAVVRAQVTADTGAVTWHRIDASGPVDDVVRAVTGVTPRP